MKIDAHHHLWKYDAGEYSWIDDSMQAIRHDFLLPELESAMASADIQGTIVVQARQTLDETRWLLQLADAHPAIRGVVGWADMCAADFSRQINELAAHRKLVGLRHVAQAEPDGFLLRSDFNMAVSMLDGIGLVYDVLIYEQQLPEAIRFVDRHAGQRLVLDHLAKPKIAKGELEPWASRMRDLARREHVVCKISGLATEADWVSWDVETLRPYLDVAVEAFGPSRLMCGSDWPVCLLATDYSQWWKLLTDYFHSFSEDEQAAIFGNTAIETYGLE